MTLDEQERAAIMEFDGGLGRLAAERLARERPWDADRSWGMPKATQPELPGTEPDYIRAIREKHCGGGK